MNAFLNFEINLIGFVILMILLGNQHRVVGLVETQRVFNAMIVTVMVMLLLDSAMWGLDGQTFYFARELYYFVTSAYYFLNCFIPFMCFLYILVFSDCYDAIFRKYKPIIMNPLIINFVLIILNLQNKWIFVINEQNCYSRGKFVILPVILAFSYLLSAGIISFHKARQAANKSEQREYMMMLMFLALPAIGGTIQMVYYGISLVWICVAISLLMLFVNVQNRQIATDALTGLNNRRQFNVQLAHMLDRVDGSAGFSLIIIDVDRFKVINDTYGHSCGDRAIIQTAEILKESSKRTNAFLSRYGGDEFAILCEARHTQALIESIEENTKHFNAIETKEFALSFSIGYESCFDGKTHTESTIISHADEKMYCNKGEKRIIEG